MIEQNNLLLLSHFRRNARAKLTDVGRETGIPVSTIFDRVKGELLPYVQRFTCLLNMQELGLHSRATIILKVDKEQKQEAGRFLEKHGNVNSLYRINNGYDFMLDVIFREMADLEEFIEQIEKRFKVKDKEVYFIIGEVKQEAFLAEPQSAALVFGGQPQPAKKAAKHK